MENKKYHRVPEEYIEEEMDWASKSKNMESWQRFRLIQKTFPSEEINKQEWISTEEQSPESGKGVLLYCKSGFITVGYRKKDKEDGFTIWQLFGDTELIIKEDDRITHWQPLPPKPKQL